MTQEVLAQRLWTAAQKDPDLRTWLRRSYRGRFDVCDALWWRANPLSPTPAGRTDPAVELIDLKAAVYRLHAEPEPVVEFVDPITQRTVSATETEHRLRTRMREQAQEDAALDALLAAAESGTAEAGRGAAGATGVPAPAGGSARSVADASGKAEPGPASGGRGRKRSFAALLVAAGALAGSLATLAGATLAGRPGVPNDAGPPARVSIDDQAPGPVEPRAAEPDVLQVFDEPQSFADGKVPDLGHRFVPTSIRSVGAAPAEAGYGVYVAQRGTAQYCLVVQNANRTGTNTCAGKANLARTGLRVTATVMGTVSVSGNPRMPVLLEVYVVWAPDGSITTTSHPHIDACVAAPANC